MTDSVPGLHWADAVQMIRPIIDSEIERGNYGGLTTPTLRDSRTAWEFTFRLDLAGLRAEFDFGEGISVVDGLDSVGRVSFRGSNGLDAFVISGSNRDRSWLARRRQAAWWRAWLAESRPAQSFENPFATVAS